MSAACSRTREWRPGRPVDLPATTGTLARGGGDPSHRRAGEAALWRATRTPDGPALLHVRVVAPLGLVHAEAWGPGASWVLDGVPELLGDADPGYDDFRPRPEHPLLVDAWRRRPGLRTPRTRAVLEALAWAGLEQVVTGKESRRSMRLLLRRYGEPAPGAPAAPGGPAAGMLVPPAPRDWARVPSWEWLRAGVERRRSAVVLRAAGVAGRLEATLGLDHAAADRALRSLPGVGRWTSAEVRQRAHGDPDAFSFDDYHVAKDVSWALTGEVLDDDGCAEVIACYTGHRYRVQRLLEVAGARRPRRAPRMTLPTHTPAATGGRS
ncbi:DNA-3-methyladenine glycosylase 2 family protein [Aquipuribacter nitratireducens]|uniref:DNA-3-methyladenine glycosylase family protein n=1 Tax=Aquipuribacter nitratireducens TaxID=650104 RepID=A0ABW0GKB0_9MICO